jgi:hypothetical protein
MTGKRRVFVIEPRRDGQDCRGRLRDNVAGAARADAELYRSAAICVRHVGAKKYLAARVRTSVNEASDGAEASRGCRANTGPPATQAGRAVSAVHRSLNRSPFRYSPSLRTSNTRL